MKRIIGSHFNKLFLAFILIFLMIGSFISLNVYASNNQNVESIIEEKKYYNGSIDDEFSDDNIIIVLSKEESNKYKEYTAADFPEIDCKSVSDLTSSTVEMLKNNKIEEIKKSLIDLDKFRRILSLELVEKSKENVIESIKKLEKRVEILSAEPNSYIQLCGTPSGSRVSEQWAFENVKAFDAWNICQDASQVIVGVLDSGIDANHSALANRIHRSEFLKDTLHRDFTNDTESGGIVYIPSDPNGHGTHVAGIIGAAGDVSGVCWDVKLVSLRTFDTKGIANPIWLIRAIDYAAKVGIPILNCSWVINENWTDLEQVIQAYKGLVVCAAGNAGNDIDEEKVYPASYNLANILTVGAIDSKNNRGVWTKNIFESSKGHSSSYGQNSVDIYAPGVGILSTVPNNGYETKSGTSMATPFVTGAAALLLAANSNLSALEIKDAILFGADSISIKVPASNCVGNKKQNVLKLNIYDSLKHVAFKVDSSGKKIVGTWFNAYGEINIPNIINGINITTIGEKAFYGCSNLTKISIPNTVENIEVSAFQGCYNLTSATLSSRLKYIEDFAFASCSNLTTIQLPYYLTKIGNYAFTDCIGLSEVIIKNGLTSIGDGAFEKCSNLEKVIIERERNIELGVNAFDECKSTLEIVVPINRVAEYKNKINWLNYKSIIVPNSLEFSELWLSCTSHYHYKTQLPPEYNQIYKLNVECAKTYKITSIASDEVKMNLYDSNMVLLGSFTNEIIQYLNKGVYYVDLEFSSNHSYGIIDTAYELKWASDGENIRFNKNNNVLQHLHKVADKEYKSEMFYLNMKGTGFFKFTLIGTTIDGTKVYYPEGAITIYRDKERTLFIDKFYSSEYSNLGLTNQEQNQMIVYLSQNGNYYIDVNMTTNELESLYLKIEYVDTQKLDLFNLSEDYSTSIRIINDSIKGDYIKKLNLEQTGKFTLTVKYNGNKSNDILFVIAKLNYDSNIDTYSLQTKIATILNNSNTQYSSTFILEKGTYFIGYFNKNDTYNFLVSFDRLVTQSGSNVLIPDPDNGSSGSQIHIYEKDVLASKKSYRGTNIVIGFTRVVYLDTHFTSNSSRNDYEWYSSNTNIAMVSAFGTILGKSKGNVKIMAVNKNNPSIVYVKSFTIIEDPNPNNEIVVIPIYETHNINKGDYKIGLTVQNCPYPIIQYYTWTIDYKDDTITSIEIDAWGRVKVEGTGELIIRGTNYLYNDKYIVELHLTVIEE